MADNKEEKEIDLLELARKLWDNKKFIIKITLIGAVAGLIIAFSIPKEYTTSVTLVTNNSTPNPGVNALASLAGVNLSGADYEALPAELYPDIIKSTPFVRGLLDMRVVEKDMNIDTTLYVYLKEGQKKAWWSYVIGAPLKILSIFTRSGDEGKDSDLQSWSKNFISKEEMSVINDLRESYSIAIDKYTTLITLEVKTQSPTITAALSDTLINHLQEYIINEKTQKARNDLANTEELYRVSKDNYYIAQSNLAAFIDRNRNVISAEYKVNQDRLQNEANLAYSIYNQMAQQLQMSKIKVQDDTPVFTVIQPGVVPLKPTKPQKKIILVAFILLSVSLASGWVCRKDIINLFK